jgi:hypothetical protein
MSAMDADADVDDDRIGRLRKQRERQRRLLRAVPDEWGIRPTVDELPSPLGDGDDPIECEELLRAAADHWLGTSGALDYLERRINAEQARSAIKALEGLPASPVLREGAIRAGAEIRSAMNVPVVHTLVVETREALAAFTAVALAADLVAERTDTGD